MLFPFDGEGGKPLTILPSLFPSIALWSAVQRLAVQPLAPGFGHAGAGSRALSPGGGAPVKFRCEVFASGGSEVFPAGAWPDWVQYPSSAALPSKILSGVGSPRGLGGVYDYFFPNGRKTPFIHRVTPASVLMIMGISATLSMTWSIFSPSVPFTMVLMPGRPNKASAWDTPGIFALSTMLFWLL
jgi:hypothetical protein